ncbi:MAG: glycosyltransferase [Gemmatimonadota bacterium]|nr:glycosyltransferase [Gemmatimonadota bacterium]
MPRFSVVVPTYNRTEALRRAIGSVLRQTYHDFEIIVVDDGSTDDTKSVVQGFADARIRYWWLPNSGGPATPRNAGIDAAKSDWISFLDSDDLWYPKKLEMVNRALSENPDVDAVSNDEIVHFAGSGKKRPITYGPVSAQFYREMLVTGNRCSTSAMTVRKGFLDAHGLRFNTSSSYVIVEDYDMWLRMALHGANFLFLNMPLGEYVVEEGNISRDVVRHRRNLLSLLHDHVFEIQSFEADRRSLWLKVEARVSSEDAFADLRARRLLGFLNHSMRAFSASPTTALTCFWSRLRGIQSAVETSMSDPLRLLRSPRK